VKKIISSGIIAIALVFAGIIAGTHTVQAETPTLAVRCSTTQARLNTLIAKVEATKTSQLATYADIQARVDAIAASAQATTFESEKLTAAQTGVKTKIDTYAAAATAYSTSLTAAKNLTCGQSDTDFTKAIETARLNLLAVRTATIAVRAYVKADITTALKAYAIWLPGATNTSEAAN